jgi:hypothetical protein
MNAPAGSLEPKPARQLRQAWLGEKSASTCSPNRRKEGCCVHRVRAPSMACTRYEGPRGRLPEHSVEHGDAEVVKSSVRG